MPNFLPSLKQPKVYIPLVIFLLLYIGINVFAYTNRSTLLHQGFLARFLSQSAPTPTPTPRPIKELPSGKQVYKVSNGTNVIGPKIQQVTLDPQTPTADETQTVTIIVKNDSPVTEALTYIHTDNRMTQHMMNLIEGTTTNGTWQGSWKITDTYNYTYFIRFDLKSTTGEYNNGMRLRE